MKSLSKKIDVYGLTTDEIQQLRQIAKERYGKASVSLLAKKLLQEQIEQPKHQNEQQTIPAYQENISENPRFTVSWLPEQYRYLLEKAKLQHDSLNSVVRDIIQEHITQNPVLSNDAVQALYQSNYQLLRIGRNINQLARQFNAILPQSITTKQLNDISEYLDFHMKIIGNIIKSQGKSFKYRQIRELNHATSESTN